LIPAPGRDGNRCREYEQKKGFDQSGIKIHQLESKP
jgi:hypothetical protein